MHTSLFHRPFNGVVCFRTRSITVVYFGLFAGLGFACAGWVLVARQLSIGLRPETFIPWAFVVFPIAIVIGSRAIEILIEWRAFLRDPKSVLLSTALSFQGGLIGTLIGLAYLSYWKDLPGLILTDTCALALPLGHAIGRLGCWSYGCCHGRPTKSRWAIRYVNPDAKAVRSAGLLGIPIHPTQLYQSIGSLVFFLALNGLTYWPSLRIGQISGLYLLIAGFGRFGLETLRGEPVVRVNGMTPYQLICIGQILAGAVLLVWVGPWMSAYPLAPYAHGASFAASFNAAKPFFPHLAVASLILLISFGVHGPTVGSIAAKKK